MTLKKQVFCKNMHELIQLDSQSVMKNMPTKASWLLALWIWHFWLTRLPPSSTGLALQERFTMFCKNKTKGRASGQM